ncbi:phosphate ABC transporter permease subunit PstC [Paracoccaceae bacterium GXU_MW_L88]
MSFIWLLLIVLIMAAAGYVIARNRAVRAVGGDTRLLHSRPTYYGTYAFIMTAVPAFLLLIIWTVGQPRIVERIIQAELPTEYTESLQSVDLAMAEVSRIANGFEVLVERDVMTEREIANISADSTNLREVLSSVGVVGGANADAQIIESARNLRSLDHSATLIKTVLTLLLAAGGLFLGIRAAQPDIRARNSVESVVMGLLLGASSIAILTTVGIVFSMLFESINFFKEYPALDFFFGTNWSPNFRGNSSLGIIPLLWGTLYISLIALLVAVPIGLMAAVYMAEYATPKVRSFAKPALEMLAGIPTIVYGLFALITVGPLLRDAIASPLGLGDSGASVATAGIVMGIMLIPFVSSLSDDVITSVPQTMRDGSLGLGATKSETVKQVILPAALPGIVGAVLLAASRAIGETMIVVLGAGAAARMSLNPFEAMTTVTVKIVSQLTGDTDFNSPETLVAFALGLTLFVMTLGLNIYAKHIVQKYQEQYE